jgi:hypothetical protein
VEEPACWHRPRVGITAAGRYRRVNLGLSDEDQVGLVEEIHAPVEESGVVQTRSVMRMAARSSSTMRRRNSGGSMN